MIFKRKVVKRHPGQRHAQQFTHNHAVVSVSHNVYERDRQTSSKDV